MVGPRRPQFVLFGSSIVKCSFREEGWGSILADNYSLKADIILRGYGGWNSRKGMAVLDQVFPKNEVVQPSLVIVYFGGNDATDPRPDGQSPHVPLPEYVENMRKIAMYLKSLSEKTRIIFLSAPPVNEAKINAESIYQGTNEMSQKYAQACVEMCHEMGIKAINLCTAIMKHSDWQTTCLIDVIHLSSIGNKIVAEEILKVIMEADWKPSLYWEAMPNEFSEL
uniref:GDSL esterase/lipase CPRD49-like n=1 Tax=Erigeron canadensis TaxID=72917 RepID=UPI001CB8AD82|nr:GDSL esterase/lipase CPRD49-like [Erigeron canadensis]